MPSDLNKELTTHRHLCAKHTKLTDDFEKRLQNHYSDKQVNLFSKFYYSGTVKSQRSPKKRDPSVFGKAGSSDPVLEQMMKDLSNKMLDWVTYAKEHQLETDENQWNQLKSLCEEFLKSNPFVLSNLCSTGFLISTTTKCPIRLCTHDLTKILPHKPRSLLGGKNWPEDPFLLNHEVVNLYLANLMEHELPKDIQKDVYIFKSHFWFDFLDVDKQGRQCLETYLQYLPTVRELDLAKKKKYWVFPHVYAVH